jgi:hypothetical protein
MLRLAEQAANAFPSALCLGVHVRIGAHDAPRIAKVNAFRDVLPGVHDRDQNTYVVQVSAYLQGFSEGR